MEWSRPSKPTVSQPDTDVTSRLCWSRYSRSSSFTRSNNHITPNIKTKPPAKPAAAPHSPAVVPPVIPPTAAPTTVRIIGRRQPIICIADLSDRSHSSLFPVPQRIECRPRHELWPLPFGSSVGPANLLPVRRLRLLSSSGPRPFPLDRRYHSLRALCAANWPATACTAPTVERATEEQRLRIVSRNERLLGNETPEFVAVRDHATRIRGRFVG